MTDRYVDCLIRCCKGALKRMSEAAPRGAEQIRAHEFKCPSCGLWWTAEDFSGANEPDTVKCSGCYGSRVLITKMRISFLEAKDFR